jgi:two-component system nitrogen regulation sensor histidine kinase NtrY
MTKPARVTQTEIPYISKDDSHRRTLLVRIAVDPEERQNAAAAVITFDDITALQSAQRKAAWADVARRIAHEIKNPLTPIQLSAERLKRKYMNQITEGADVFAQCTDTIIHHVGDIGRMVNEFSSFARMPEPVLKRERLEPLVRETVVLLQQAHPDIDFTIHCSPGLESEVDARQVRQAVSNIVQNAVDSVLSRMEKDGLARGNVDILLMQRKSGEDNVIAVTDSGAGFPPGSDTAQLTEPYVTHKERGTGLGLAIVKKIMEDHGGKLVLGAPDWLRAFPEWREPEGATVLLVFPAAAIEQRRAMA